MPRLSWSLAAALSMSAIAVFRPDVGSKSLAAHAARSFTRVVESIAQRFHAGSVRVASGTAVERAASRIDPGLTAGEAAPQSGVGSGHSSPLPVGGSEPRLAKTVPAASAALSNDGELQLGTDHLDSLSPKYSSPPVAFFASLQGLDSIVTPPGEQRQPGIAPRAHERLWKDCAVAAICSGIPGPATLRSTPQALGKPPSV